jgi:DNA-binding SARP family transcriptional activator
MSAAPDRPASTAQTGTLVRERLCGLLPSLWSARLGLVVAPAGSGKTTLLAHLGAAAGCPVVWYLAESTDSTGRAFVARLERLLAAAVPNVRRSWRRPEDAADALDDALERRTVLAVDDFHVLHGTAAERALERFVRRSPSLLTVLIAGRTRPNLNLSQLRASGALVEVGADDLRFRSWEVERLFHDVYREPLPPESLADLTRRTEGWAAGLQLFHLATQGRPPLERRRTLAGLGARRDLVREYLTRNVLDDLPPELRRFLIDTCVLSRLSGPLCDTFLNRPGSDRLLHELERRQIFTQAFPDGTYRYHEVLRAHLEATFVAATGDAQAQASYRRAGKLLEAEGALQDALRAYCRAEAWNEIARLLGRRGERAVASRAEWLAELPGSIVRDDPWLLLAAARAERAAGRLAAAVALYHEAERLFPSAEASAICLHERLALGAWLDPSVPPTSDALGLLRQATIREPLAARRRAAAMPDPAALLTAGVAALLAGHAVEGGELLARAAEDPDTQPSLAAAARVGLAIGLQLRGDRQGLPEIERAAEAAENAASTFLVRVSRAALALGGTTNGTLEATASRVTSELEGDLWGSLLATLLEGWGTLAAGEDAVRLFELAVQTSRALGAGVLESWARAGLSLAEARSGAPEARASALQAEVAARLVGAKGAQGLAYLALADCDPSASAEYRALARAIEEECGIVLPAGPQTLMPGPDSAPLPLELRCFGGFSIAVRGSVVDLSPVKPRARRALRCLALHAGRAVHREVLIEALWPGGDATRSRRHLHVLISTLRRVLEPGLARGESQLIVRDGEAYRLDLPAGAWADVVEFDRAVAQGRSARNEGRDGQAIEWFRHAMDLYAGDLLPEDGPADWVVDERELRRAGFCEAAHGLAELLLSRGEALSAALVCERAIHADRYTDTLWRTCAAAYEQAGDTAAAERTRRKYRRVLAELGLDAAVL